MFPNPAYRHTAPPWPIVVLCVSHNPKKAPGPPLRLNRQAHGTSSWLAIAQGLYQKIIGAKPEFLLPSQPFPPFSTTPTVDAIGSRSTAKAEGSTTSSPYDRRPTRFLGDPPQRR